MTESYIEKVAFLSYLNGLRDSAPGTKADLLTAVKEYLSKAETLQIVRCRNCNTFSTQGVAEGYGWCKKFCFGPEKDFYCYMGAPWDEDEADPDENGAEKNGSD